MSDIESNDRKPYVNRPFLQVLFECCGAYQRIYKDPVHAKYEGRCPRCLRPVRFRVAPNGTSARAFSVY